MRQLIFLKIGIDPEPLRRDDTQEICAIGDVSTDLGGPVADVAVDRRADLGVAQIEARGFKIRLGLGDIGAGCGNFRIEHAQLLPCGVKRRLGRFGGGLHLPVEGRRALGILPGAEGGRCQIAIADGVLIGKCGAGDLGVQIRLGLFNCHLLQHVFRFERRPALACA